jgi:hypothetical protein
MAKEALKSTNGNDISLRRTHPKRSIFPQSILECAHFSAEFARNLVDAEHKSVGRPLDRPIADPAIVLTKLNTAALMFAIGVSPYGRHTPSGLVKRFTAIAAAARRLLRTLSTPRGNHNEVPSELMAGGLIMLFSASLIRARDDDHAKPIPIDIIIKSIFHLQILAEAAAERYSTFEAEPRRKRREAKSRRRTSEADRVTTTHYVSAARHQFLLALIDIWEEQFGRKDIGAKAFQAFSEGAFEVVEPGTTATAVRRRIERVRSPTKK